jgi:mannose-6-phosphate isomerase-like protein (cupin superfamily)
MSLPEWLVKAGASDTGGAYELIQETRAVEGGPAPHVHRERDEGFLVLEGRYRFIRGDEETEVGEGAFVFVPRGFRHTFRTLAAPSRVLIVVAPAGLDGYFREMAEGLAAGRAAPDIMLELSARFDTHPVP